MNKPVVIGTEHAEVSGMVVDHSSHLLNVMHLADDGSHLEEALQGNYVQLDPMSRYSDRSIDLLLEALRGVGENERPDTSI